MKRKLIMTAVLLLASPLALANQVTGQVVEMTDARIVIKKGKSDLEIARDAGTRLAGDVKVGDRVTVGYNDRHQHRTQGKKEIQRQVQNQRSVIVLVGLRDGKTRKSLPVFF